ncbi:protein of unknown function [Bradyrhizobium vignae]|uniref:Uncharacterized protein n=1 Tax=Bradyrhizobium vignae TaxID=1549949 RepID=A0A2U3Q110_9BRAD|nr:protein of unknown function [Bradyrhizobium vignae]
MTTRHCGARDRSTGPLARPTEVCSLSNELASRNEWRLCADAMLQLVARHGSLLGPAKRRLVGGHGFEPRTLSV